MTFPVPRYLEGIVNTPSLALPSQRVSYEREDDPWRCARPVLIASINHVERAGRCARPIRVVVPSCIHDGALAHAASAFASCRTFELLTSTRRRNRSRTRFPHILAVYTTHVRANFISREDKEPEVRRIATIGLLKTMFASPLFPSRFRYSFRERIRNVCNYVFPGSGGGGGELHVQRRAARITAGREREEVEQGSSRWIYFRRRCLSDDTSITRTSYVRVLRNYRRSATTRAHLRESRITVTIAFQLAD